ncbi:MAG TPA: 2-phospho-L-lactate guanylyltransferase [bacterium]|nr:2-phospho-L-lactate guanylyltransferase [bacterium]
MRARAVVPQKALSGAKSRLEGVLSAAGRAALSLALLRHVCAALRAVPGVESVVVMTPDYTARAAAAAWGVGSVIDPRPGLNASLGQVVRDGAREYALLVVAADLPLLTPDDVVALLAPARRGRLVLAPSKEGTGTNAVVVPPGTAFQPAYGTASLAAHRRGARALGLDVVEVRRPGLAFDVDTEADFLAVRYCESFVSVAPTPDGVRCGWR